MKKCKAYSCKRQVPDRMWFCDDCWDALGREHRRQIIDAMTVSREREYDDVTDFRPFMRALHMAIAHLAHLADMPHVVAAHHRLADMYARPMTSYPGEG